VDDVVSELRARVLQRDVVAVRFLVESGLVSLVDVVEVGLVADDGWVFGCGVVPFECRDWVLRLALLRDAPRVVAAFIEGGWCPNSVVRVLAFDAMSALSNAVCLGRVGIVEVLVGAGADVNAVHERDSSFVVGVSAEPRAPLYYAAERGFVDCARVLLRAGASVNALCGPREAPSVLHAAALCGRNGVVELMLEFGANPMPVAGASVRSPLYHAVRCGFVDSAVALLAAGAECDEHACAGVGGSVAFRESWGRVWDAFMSLSGGR
jgi:hypothetical protein